MTAVPQVQIAARDYYVRIKGVPLDAAIALVSVLYRESGLKPGSQGYQSTETPGVLNPHGAYGIASWNGPRQQDLLDFATKQGLPVDVLATQLAFVLTEIANKYPACWAAIRSSASYQSIIAIIVNEYEDPKNKPVEINDAVKIAAALAALPAPQQASPAAVPQVPAPIPPSTQTPIPAAPAGAPIAPATAGRRSAYQQEMAAYADYLASQQAAINAEFDAEIAEVRAIANRDFGTVSLPPAASTAAQPQEGNKMTLALPANWKTTLSGLIAAASSGIGAKYPEYQWLTSWLTPIALGALGLSAKDDNVTGGTVSAVTGAVGKPVSLIDKQ